METVEVTLYLTGVTNKYIRTFNEWVSGTGGTHLGVGVDQYVYHMTDSGFKRTRLVNFSKCNTIKEKLKLRVSRQHLDDTIRAFRYKAFSSKRFNYNCLMALFRRTGLRFPSLRYSDYWVTCADFPGVLFRGDYCSHYQTPGEMFESLKCSLSNEPRDMASHPEQIAG